MTKTSAPNAPPAKNRIAHRKVPTRSSNVGEIRMRPRRFRKTWSSEAWTNSKVIHDQGAGRSPRKKAKPRSRTTPEDWTNPKDDVVISRAYTARIATPYTRESGDRKSTRLNSSHRCISY